MFKGAVWGKNPGIKRADMTYILRRQTFGICYCLVQEMATEADPTEAEPLGRWGNCGVMQLANQKASFPVEKTKRR